MYMTESTDHAWLRAQNEMWSIEENDDIIYVRLFVCGGSFAGGRP